MTKLSEELVHELAKQPDQPLWVEHPETHEKFVLLNSDAYRRMQESIQEQSPMSTSEDDLIRQAIRNRREESRRLNEEWQHVDAETWPQN